MAARFKPNRFPNSATSEPIRLLGRGRRQKEIDVSSSTERSLEVLLTGF